MRRYNVVLDEADYARARDRARRRGLNFSKYVRGLVAADMKKEREPFDFDSLLVGKAPPGMSLDRMDEDLRRLARRRYGGRKP